jgi:aminoglycoside/choline kinase family phosphotransferase
MSGRRDLAGAFIARAGWGAAERRHLAGDASDRSYERLVLAGRTAVLMDAPPGKGDDPADFLAIAAHLRGLGLSAPKVLAEDLGQGFLLLEDLGDDLFMRCIAADRALEVPLTVAAAEVLAHLQAAPAPAGLPDLTADDWAEAAAFAPDWYGFAATGVKADRAAFTAELGELLAAHADGPRVLILRDYHAENLLWLPARAGLAKVGLLDFQLAQMGQPGYDLVSLVQDARRDVGAEAAEAAVRRFMDLTGAEEAAFRRALAVLGAQRALRIIGIFARLCLMAGKPGYLAHLPRVWGQLRQNLSHPALNRLAGLSDALLPPPTPETLDRIRQQCPTNLVR